MSAVRRLAAKLLERRDWSQWADVVEKGLVLFGEQ
jgi:hypothetical protein